MRFLLLVAVFIVGCTSSLQEVERRRQIIENGKELCHCQGGPWFYDFERDFVKCNNGRVFNRVSKLAVYDLGCE